MNRCPWSEADRISLDRIGHGVQTSSHGRSRFRSHARVKRGRNHMGRRGGGGLCCAENNSPGWPSPTDSDVKRKVSAMVKCLDTREAAACKVAWTGERVCLCENPSTSITANTKLHASQRQRCRELRGADYATHLSHQHSKPSDPDGESAARGRFFFCRFRIFYHTKTSHYNF